MLAASAQESLRPVDMGYNPTVTDAKGCRPTCKKRIGFTPDEQEAPGRSRLRLHGEEQTRRSRIGGNKSFKA